MDFKISDTNKGKKSLIYDGFIYRIDAHFFSAHPSIFVFMDVLQKVQATTYLKMKSTDQAVTARKEDKHELNSPLVSTGNTHPGKSPDWST